ncbi:mammalian cell entry protein [Mycobacterium sp. MS1601]|uniref:MCE family protein n=1 Tax=Mycobacterium sp. MS1601 TaxID=1936029 RepID=UPI0009794E66|nr:MCE family protein [Mycobacterium sp. MS1601]AQA05449.1 mammalian cell entry protein [Mycobacterium sp. MS1601]
MKRIVCAAVCLVALTGCSSWRGVNSLPLPGTEGRGEGTYQIQVQLPDVSNIQPNSRVRVGDVNVGNVTGIERQGWHALLTIDLNGDVELPANSTATVGQTSLLGSLHVELAPPIGIAPQGRLQDGALIPLSSSGAYPSTEQTLAAVSTLLNNGGVGRLQDLTDALGTALAGRGGELHTLITQLDTFIAHVDSQTDDITGSVDELNGLVGQVAAQQPVVDRAIETIPDALAVLSQQRDHLAEALVQFGQFAAVTADSVNLTKEALISELEDLAPVLKSLADAGPAMTRSLSHLGTFPWPKETIGNWIRGDYGNLSLAIDLTLSRLDASLFTGTRWEGDLTALELQWGRTLGQKPSPYTAGNPLVVPYQTVQGP